MKHRDPCNCQPNDNSNSSDFISPYQPRASDRPFVQSQAISKHSKHSNTYYQPASILFDIFVACSSSSCRVSEHDNWYLPNTQYDTASNQLKTYEPYGCCALHGSTINHSIFKLFVPPPVTNSVAQSAPALSWSCGYLYMCVFYRLR